MSTRFTTFRQYVSHEKPTDHTGLKALDTDLFVPKAVFWGLMATVVWSPFPFGSVEPWAQSLLQSVTWILAVMWVVHLTAKNQPALDFNPLQFLLLAGVALATIQLFPLWHGAPISFDPYTTHRSLVVLLSHSLLFSLALQTLQSPGRMDQVVPVLIGLGAGIALFGIAQHFTWNGKMYWVREIQNGSPFGPFVNRNHAAGLFELLVPVAFCGVVNRFQGTTLRLVYALATLLMIGAIMLTQSIGGILSLIAEVCVLAVFFRLRFYPIRRHRLVMAGVLTAVLVGSGFHFGGFDKLVAKLAQTGTTVQTQANLPDRVSIWRDTGKLISDHPLTGIGLGAFETAFTRYDSGNGIVRVEQAHNDYLQVAADLGIFGVLLVSLFLGLFFTQAWKRLSGRALTPFGESLTSDQFWRLGAWTGCIGLLVHSVVDFNLQIPSNALVFLMLVAITVAKSTENRSATERNCMSTVRPEAG